MHCQESGNTRSQDLCLWRMQKVTALTHQTTCFWLSVALRSLSSTFAIGGGGTPPIGGGGGTPPIGGGGETPPVGGGGGTPESGSDAGTSSATSSLDFAVATMPLAI